MSSIDWASAALRLGLYAALIFLFGVPVFRIVFAPGNLGGLIAGRLQTSMLAAAILTLVCVVFSLPVLAATIADDWSGAFDWPTLFALLATPDIALVWFARVTLAGLLAIQLRLFPAMTVVSAAIVTLLLVSLSLSGHAAMQEGAVGWLHTVNHGVHVVAASLWLGSLVPLLICLGDLRQPPLRYEAICALRRFSWIGHGAVACVFVTGTVNIWLILGQWPVDWTSPYRALLAAKITLVIIMIAVALVNRYVFTPRIAADEVRALGAIAHNTLIEIGLGAMVLALVAIFGLLEPI